jgi:hypothetical protein
MNSTEFMALYEAAIIRNEQTLWADITRRENSFVGRFKRLINSMRCIISNGWQR